MPRPEGFMKPERRSRAWIWNLVGIAVFVALAVAAAHGIRVYLANSPKYRVRQVVVNTQTLNEDLLRAHLGVKTGTPIFGINLVTLRGKLMEVPTIASARVTRRLPDTLIIEIEEREPVARLGRTNLMVDNAGSVFVLPGGSRILPIITGYQKLGKGTPLAPGDRASGMMVAAIELLRFAGEGEGMLPVTDIDLSSEDYLLCTLSDQRQARIAWDQMMSRSEASRAQLQSRVCNLIAAMNDPKAVGHVLFDASLEPNKVHMIP